MFTVRAEGVNYIWLVEDFTYNQRLVEDIRDRRLPMKSGNQKRMSDDLPLVYLSREYEVPMHM